MSITDNLLHVAGGALLALPLYATNPLLVFLVFSIWGLLREQAQKHTKGLSAKQNWIGPGIWSVEKLVEGVAWGVGGALITWIV